MEPVLSVLVYSIGAMDIMECFLYFVAHMRGDTLKPLASDDSQQLEEFKTSIKDTISQTKVPENEALTCTQDGTLFKDQFRLDDIDEQKLDEIGRKIDELANRLNVNNDNNNNNNNNSSSNDATSDEKNNLCDDEKIDENNNTQSSDLVVDDKENELLYVVRSVESHVQNSGVIDSRVLIEAEKHDAQMSIDSSYGSMTPHVDEHKLRPIVRDDELRRSIRKRSADNSPVAHEMKQEELQVLTSIEQAEQQDLDDYVPIIYPGTTLTIPDDDDDSNDDEYENELETIPEVHSSSPEEQQADDEIESRKILDKSPIPHTGIAMTYPWGDVQNKELQKTKEVFKMNKSISIEEVPGDESEDASLKAPISDTIPEVMSTSQEPIEDNFESNSSSDHKIKKREVSDSSLNVDDVENDQPSTSSSPDIPKEELTLSTTKSDNTPDTLQIDEPVIIQKKIQLIGITPPVTPVPDKKMTNFDSNDNQESKQTDSSETRDNESKHDGNRTPDLIERNKLLPQESECLEDTEEATLLFNLKEEKLGVDVDNQYLDDPQIQEMTNYVKKLTKAKTDSIDEVDEENEVDAEYYWKPPKSTMISWQSTEDLTKEEYVRKKIDSEPLECSSGERKPSLAEMIIIPKNVTESSEDLLKKLENEALEYQQFWGLNTPENMNSIKKRHAKRSQSISMGVFTRQRPKVLRDRERRESIADTFIIPKSCHEAMSEESLNMLEKEALEYQELWGLDNPSDMEDIQRRSSLRSQSISMGVLSRQKNKLLERRMRKRDSIAEVIIIPRMSIGSVDEETLKILENEALEYQQLWGLDIPSAVVEKPVAHKIDYNEWYDRFDAQMTSHLETTFTDDEEEAELKDVFQSGQNSAEIQVKNRIYHTFSGPTTPQVEITKTLFPDDIQQPPITPADYDTFMQKFPEQLTPDIQMQDGRKSPATLETYLERMRSPSPCIPAPPTPSPRALTPVEFVSHPPSLEVYLERMKSKSHSPSPNPK